MSKPIQRLNPRLFLLFTFDFPLLTQASTQSLELGTRIIPNCLLSTELPDYSLPHSQP
jgi:hypothetical protein